MFLARFSRVACRNFHHFLWASRFTVVTDHQRLTSVFKRKTKFPHKNRWILEMREYQYDIQYVKGKYNYVADQLSWPVRIIVRQPEATWFGQENTRETNPLSHIRSVHFRSEVALFRTSQIIRHITILVSSTSNINSASFEGGA